MIDSLAQEFQDVNYWVKKTKLSTREKSKQDDSKLKQKAHNLIRGNSVLSYFLRMSWNNKTEFIRNIIKRIQNVSTTILFLTTLHSVTGKINHYCISTPKPPIDFDRMAIDHDRMLEPKILECAINDDLDWFEELDDKEQIGFFVTLIRYSGGAMIRVMYQHLNEMYIEQIRKLSLENRRMKEDKNEKNTEQNKYDNENPKNQKVIELEKEWNIAINKIRKEVQKRMPKEKKNKPKKKDKGKKKQKKDKKKKKKKSKKKNKKGSLDWIQLMPIYIVKKIFSYLDNKTLKKAQKVNEYWKWAIGDYLKDKKMRKSMNKTNKKLKKLTGLGESNIQYSTVLKPPKPRISQTEKRIIKLKDRGAILDKMRFRCMEATDYSAALFHALRDSKSVPLAENMSLFPRVPRTKQTLFKKPNYIIKDVEIICKNVEDTSDSEDASLHAVGVSTSVTTASSDDWIF